MVPLFLLVGGAVWCGYCLILVLRRTVHKCRKRRRAQANGNETGDVPPVSPAAGGDDDAEEATHPAMKAFDTLVSSFCFGWFIAGTIIWNLDLFMEYWNTRSSQSQAKSLTGNSIRLMCVIVNRQVSWSYGLMS